MGWWVVGRENLWGPHPGRGEESARGGEDPLLPKGEEAAGSSRTPGLVELEKATERLKGSGGS